VRGSNLQNMPHITAARIAGAHGVGSIRACYLLLKPLAEFYDDLNLGIESMHVARLMIFGVSDKPDAIETNRARNLEYADLRFEGPSFLYRRQRLLQVGDQVFFVFDADGEANAPLGNAHRRALLLGH